MRIPPPGAQVLTVGSYPNGATEVELLHGDFLGLKKKEKKKKGSTHSFIAPVFENVKLSRNHGLKRKGK